MDFKLWRPWSLCPPIILHSNIVMLPHLLHPDCFFFEQGSSGVAVKNYFIRLIWEEDWSFSIFFRRNREKGEKHKQQQGARTS